MADATLTISFASTTGSSEQFIILDLDTEKNDDESTFLFGEEVYIRMFTNCTEVNFFISEGTLQDGPVTNSEVVEVSELITFDEPPESFGGKASENTASLSFPVFSDFVAKSMASSAPFSVSIDSVDVRQANASAAGVGVFKATYKTKFTPKTLLGPSIPPEWDSEENYPVVVLAVGS